MTNAIFSAFLSAAPLQTTAHWVWFTDRGALTEAEEEALIAEREAELSPKAVARLAKHGVELGERDLPVNQQYIEAVTGTEGVKKLRTVIRFLNAVSVDATPEAVRAIEALPFVLRVTPVARYTKEMPEEGHPALPNADSTQYSWGWNQTRMLNADCAHDLGNFGQGTLIGFLDTGFELDHQALDSLDLLGTWDFIFGDTNVAYDPSQDSAGQSSHGTLCFGTVAGWYPGEIIGIAPKATFALGKTEWIADETPVEEDYWTAGIQWLDSLGADVVSSSLGYIAWYTWPDLNGDSCVTTIAADWAAQRGIIVVTAMGNEGNGDGITGTLIAPADADSSIGVGAVDWGGGITSFSSTGPTYDGRTKPVLMAQGEFTYTIEPYTTNQYNFYSGTSLSTPLLGGVATLVVSAVPAATNMEVIGALKATADNSSSPDNFYGWGIPDVCAAINYLEVKEASGGGAVGFRLLSTVISARLAYEAPREGNLNLYDALGRKVLMKQVSAGKGEITTRNLPRGAYFARYENEPALRFILH